MANEFQNKEKGDASRASGIRKGSLEAMGPVRFCDERRYHYYCVTDVNESFSSIISLIRRMESKKV